MESIEARGHCQAKPPQTFLAVGSPFCLSSRLNHGRVGSDDALDPELSPYNPTMHRTLLS